MHVYIHRIMVTVVTPECSPDKIERQIEETLSTVQNSVCAETDRENRMRSPGITIPDPPAWPYGGSKADEAAYFTAHDTWRDAHFPRADSKEVQTR